MEWNNGNLITAETREQEEAMKALHGFAFHIEDPHHLLGKPKDEVLVIDKTPRKYEAGDADSLKTQNTTATQMLGSKLQEALERAKDFDARDQSKETGEASD